MTKSTLDKDKAIVVFSGGQDSTTCLFYAKKHFKEVELVTFNYGQRHDTEIEVARKIANEQNLKHHILDMSLQSGYPEKSVSHTPVIICLALTW